MQSKLEIGGLNISDKPFLKIKMENKFTCVFDKIEKKIASTLGVFLCKTLFH